MIEVGLAIDDFQLDIQDDQVLGQRPTHKTHRHQTEEAYFASGYLATETG